MIKMKDNRKENKNHSDPRPIELRRVCEMIKIKNNRKENKSHSDPKLIELRKVCEMIKNDR